MSSLTYQERSLYGKLFADLAIFVPYFVLIHTGHPSISFIAGSFMILILAQFVLQFIIANVTRNRLKDERDRLIALRGYRAGYFTIISLMVLGIGLLKVHSMHEQLNVGHMGLHFLSVFFAVLMLAEVVKTVAQLIAYRRPL
jgi:uncharacterized membrane protein